MGIFRVKKRKNNERERRERERVLSLERVCVKIGKRKGQRDFKSEDGRMENAGGLAGKMEDETKSQTGGLAGYLA